MKIGLYFGSFNPIHVGHVIISNCLINNTDLDEIWFVISPHNPLKKKSNLLNAFTRLELVHLALKNYNKIKASDIEFKLPKPSYTIDTLNHLKEKYPKHEFCLIMGEDNLNNLPKWKNHEIIIENYKIYVYPRLNNSCNNLTTHKNIKIIENVPIIEISSSIIRNLIAKNKEYSAFLPDEVFKYIEKGNYYRSIS